MLLADRFDRVVELSADTNRQSAGHCERVMIARIYSDAIMALDALCEAAEKGNLAALEVVRGEAERLVEVARKFGGEHG